MGYLMTQFSCKRLFVITRKFLYPVFNSLFFLSLILPFSKGFAEVLEVEEDAAPLIVEKPIGEAFAFYIENDSRFVGGPGTDNGYSNGLKVSYIYAQNRIPNWSRRLVERTPFLDQKLKIAKVNFGISLGHQIFTPSDTQAEELVVNDRPYAGFLYLGFALSLKKEFSEQFFEVALGTVGPSSLAETVQNGYHRLIDIPQSRGWKNGLNDEPVIRVNYQHRIKTIKKEHIEFIPFYGLGIGNVMVAAHAGGLVRLGFHLPNTFGSSRPSASNGNSFISSSLRDDSKKTSYYIFGGLRGNLVARNLFLDGNTLRNSHRVTKYPVNYETELGAGLQTEKWGLVWSFVVQSPEFEERSRYNSFGSISLVYIF